MESKGHPVGLTNGGSFTDKVNFIWSVADTLRGDYKASEYGRVILPLVVIRRLDCVLAPTKEAVVARAEQLAGRVDNPDEALKAAAGGLEFWNTSPLDFTKLTADPTNVATNLRSYIRGFSPGAQEVIDKFRFDEQITRLEDAQLLYQVIAKFADIDLHPSSVDNHEMGYIYEELIRRFSEQSNETAGEHFTPREVIRLMVDLLLVEDDQSLRDPGVIRTLFDPACGTGGMLAVAEERLHDLNPHAYLHVYGQELNDESYAICRSDMMLKGHSAENIASGNSFSQDAFVGRRFDYLLANPPFGVKWKKVERVIKEEAKNLGFTGRFGAGVPGIKDGSFLFLQHMISKMKAPEEGGARLAIVFNGSPLFKGAAGSDESEIRRWIIENDWLEAVIALPDQLFYNTPIFTYFWILTNRKSPARKGLVQLVDARDLWEKMPKSLGDKRKQISGCQIDEIVALYAGCTEGDRVKLLPNESFGFQRISVERPLIGDDGNAVTDRKGNAKPDPKRRDQENVPLPAGPPTWEQADEGAKARLVDEGHRAVVDEYVAAEIHPWVPDAWVDHSKTKIGYEIPVTRHFFRYTPPRPVAEIDAEIDAIEARLTRLREKRASFISEGVEGQLLAGKPRRPSSLPWLRTLPQHWREAKLTLLASLGSGHTPSRSHPEWWVNCTIPWITTGEVAQMRSDRIEYIKETRERISEAGVANSSAVVHPAGTVVLCRTAASAGYSAIMATDMATSQDIATWTCGPHLRPRFLLLCMRAMRTDLLERLAVGSTHKTIYMPDIESIRVPVPPVEEQDEVVAEVWRRLTDVDEATDLLETEKELLADLRRSLISAAVAGELQD